MPAKKQYKYLSLKRQKTLYRLFACYSDLTILTSYYCKVDEFRARNSFYLSEDFSFYSIHVLRDIVEKYYAFYEELLFYERAIVSRGISLSYDYLVSNRELILLDCINKSNRPETVTIG